MQQTLENVPAFLSRMERDTFGAKNNYNESQDKIEVEHLEMVYEINRRSRSHSRERDNYDRAEWDRSEIEGPPSNEEVYKTSIRDKSRKSEMSQIERERESLLVYQPKHSEKTIRNSQSDQATFKNHSKFGGVYESRFIIYSYKKFQCIRKRKERRSFPRYHKVLRTARMMKKKMSTSLLSMEFPSQF